MFLFPRREAPPEGRARAFLLHHPFRFFQERNEHEKKESNRTCYLFRALAEHTRGRPPQIQNKPRPPGRHADEAEEAHATA